MAVLQFRNDWLNNPGEDLAMVVFCCVLASLFWPIVVSTCALALFGFWFVASIGAMFGAKGCEIEEEQEKP